MNRRKFLQGLLSIPLGWKTLFQKKERNYSVIGWGDSKFHHWVHYYDGTLEKHYIDGKLADEAPELNVGPNALIGMSIWSEGLDPCPYKLWNKKDAGPPITAEIKEIWHVFDGAYTYTSHKDKVGWLVWHDEKGEWEDICRSSIWIKSDQWHYWLADESRLYCDGEMIVSWEPFP